MSPADFHSTYGSVKPSVDDTSIVFHCKAGRRSRIAMDIAQRHGYTQWAVNDINTILLALHVLWFLVLGIIIQEWMDG